MRNKKFKSIDKKWALVFVFYFLALLVIFILAYFKLIPVEISYFPLYDRLGHFFLFGLLFFFLHRLLNRKSISLFKIKLPLAGIIVLSFAAGEEILQLLSPNRTFSVLDLLMDLGGVLFFYGVDLISEKIKIKIKRNIAVS